MSLSRFVCVAPLLQEACQNYIRVLLMTTPGILLACGTNSFRPMCHYYNITGSDYHIEKQKPGQALCPYGPQHNSTSVFVGEFVQFAFIE
jgi:semaphorin 6